MNKKPNDQSSSKTHRIISLIIIIFVPLCFTFYLLINYFFFSKMWIDGYYPVYFGQFDGHYPLFSSWWSNLGIGEYPFFFNILLYPPLKVFIQLSGEYVGWILYLAFLFFASIICFCIYIRKLFTGVSTLYAVLLGAVYASYIGFNKEIIYYSLKICVAFIPLSIYLLLLTYSSIGRKSKFKNIVIAFICFSFLLLNYVIFDPRSIIALTVLLLIHLIYLYLRDRDIKKLFLTSLWMLGGIIGGIILYYPIKYPQAISYVYSGQLAAATSSSVVTSSGLMSVLFHSNPSLHFTPLMLISILFFVMCLFLSLIRMKNTSRNLYYLVILLLIMYLIFTERKFLTFLTVYLPYGQLFRTWEIGQYIVNFFLPIALVGVFLQKKVTSWLRNVAILAIIIYIAVSVFDFNQQLVFVNKTDLDTYKDIDAFLNSDTSNYKVLWTPEMGWHGKNVRPTWLGNYQPSAQAFPEFVSSKPTYLHYFTPMTHAYTWLASGHWKSELMSNKSSANLLNILGIKYVIVHTDVPGYNENAKKIVQQLQNNNDYKLVKQEKYLYVFKNLSFKSRVWAVPIVKSSFCDGGLYCLSSFFANNSTYRNSVFLTDQLANSDILGNLNSIHFSLPDPDYNNLIINHLLENKNKDSKILFAKDYTSSLNSIGCLSDTHQGEYHPLFSLSESYDYANTYVFGNCFIILNNVQKPVTISTNLNKGNYVMLIKYLAQHNGENFNISSQYFDKSYVTRTDNAINYYRYDKQLVKIPTNSDVSLKITNTGGVNSISLIAFIPESLYVDKYTQISKDMSISNSGVSNKNVITVTNLKEINSSEWSLDVESTTPFILNFAEAFNPYWKATVSSDKDTQDVMSSQLDGMINGFYINKTGKSHISLYYTPQKKYERDFAISIGAFSLLVLGLIIVRKVVRR